MIERVSHHTFFDENDRRDVQERYQDLLNEFSENTRPSSPQHP
jgi:hypothetical protein